MTKETSGRLVALIAMSVLFRFIQPLIFSSNSAHRLTQSRIGRACSRCRSSQSELKSESLENMVGWTVSEACTYAVEKLEEANVVEPEASVPHLIAAALNLDWDTGYRDVMNHPHQSIQLTEGSAGKFNSFLKRRLQHEPIQYILGQWDFLDYTVSVRSPLLCPRPETEEMVLSIVAECKGTKNLHILDIGCGTGIIGLSLADQLDHSIVQAIDIEPIAVSTSLENAHRIFQNDASKMSRYKCNLVSLGDFVLEEGSDRFDLVVSNPPYIPTADYERLSRDVVDYESRSALEAGIDGMDVIYDIIERIPRANQVRFAGWK
eukprot:scaffold22610_cov115-Cylindrotheca_fusiformis.AAC.7